MRAGGPGWNGGSIRTPIQGLSIASPRCSNWRRLSYLWQPTSAMGYRASRPTSGAATTCRLRQFGNFKPTSNFWSRNTPVGTEGAMNDVIRKLRDVVPIRPLSMQEAMQIAELQAN